MGSLEINTDMSAPEFVAALPPFRIEPQFVERVWGPADLRPWYDHVTDSGSVPIGEVWLTGDACVVSTGPLKGKTLEEVFAEKPLNMLGAETAEIFPGLSPLLLKVIFAKEKLSVQVHPDDLLAQKYGEPRGKTECWYALTADAGAAVAAGLKPGTTLEAIERGVVEGTLEDDLEVLPVVAGDMIFVDAGTVHAIWPGSVLLETQQYSDLTYRLYDYGRPRPLHVAKALEATRLHTDAGKVAPVKLDDRTVLIDREYFCVEKIAVPGFRDGSSMASAEELENGSGVGLAYLFAAAGSGQITNCDPRRFRTGRSPRERSCRHPCICPTVADRKSGRSRANPDHAPDPLQTNSAAEAGLSSMSNSEWRQAVQDYIRREAQPVDKFGHQPRLYALAVKIAEGLECDDDILFAAAWMHDLGVFLGHRPADPQKLAGWDHVPYTIARSRELLESWGFPAEKLDAVAEVIRTHQPNDVPISPEAVVLRDADILEQLGAIGVLRSVVKVGRDTRFATYSEILPVLKRALAYLPSQLRMERSREIGVRKVLAIQAFVDAVSDEAGSALY